MRIPLDHNSATPLYQQVQDYIRNHILSGQLEVGSRLPATRGLADKLQVSRITIQNAYANLESEGLIASREGSGAYVLAPLDLSTDKRDGMIRPSDWPLWQSELAQSFVKEPSPELPRPKSNLEMISFMGVGDTHHFPIKDLQRSLRAVLQHEGTAALEYGSFGAGYLPLRETIASILASQGIQTYPENVLITSGSQQALSLVCQALLKPRDVVLVEKPTYNMALDLFRTLGLKIGGVPVDKDGWRIDELEHLIQKYHPKLLYTIPNFQNPSGMCMSGERRRQLVALAERYNVPILEDDFAGDLRYTGRAQPAVKALDANGHVIYVGTFSKMLMPGLRMGYVVADGPIFDHLVQLKQVTDLTTSTLIQRAINEYVTLGRYQTHLCRSKRLYRKRRDEMLRAIAKHLPDDVSIIPPSGGLFVWLRLPQGMLATELRQRAAVNGVKFAPGTWFFSNLDEGQSYIRLNFATNEPEKITEGIKRLGRALERSIATETP